MSSDKEIKGHIASISNTRQITSAMEKVAASKIRRSQQSLAKSRPYSDSIRSVVGHLASSSSEYSHPWLAQNNEKAAKPSAVGLIVLSTDKGLCGGLNAVLFRSVLKFLMQMREQGTEVKVCSIGRKASLFFRRFAGVQVSQLEILGEKVDLDQLRMPVNVLLQQLTQGELQQVHLARNLFLSSVSQQPKVEKLLPLLSTENQGYKGVWDYLYEPEAKELLDGLLQRYVEAVVYQAVIENQACEQAAKMLAMKNATDNATDLIAELQLQANKARQAVITREISEIVSGAGAV